MVSAKGVAIGIVTSVGILMIPYLLAFIFDWIFISMGVTSLNFSFTGIVTPLYVLALRLFLVGVSFGFQFLDVVLNLGLQILNLIPAVNITWTIDTHSYIITLSDQIDQTILDFVTATSLSTVIITKTK